MKSRLAITSFILGILSLSPILLWILSRGVRFSSTVQLSLIFIFGLAVLASISGLIIGIISIFSIRQNKIEGVWFSIFGIVFSLMGLLLFALFIFGLGKSMGSFL